MNDTNNEHDMVITDDFMLQHFGQEEWQSWKNDVRLCELFKVMLGPEWPNDDLEYDVDCLCGWMYWHKYNQLTDYHLRMFDDDELAAIVLEYNSYIKSNGGSGLPLDNKWLVERKTSPGAT